MSPLRMGSATVTAVSGDELSSQADALREAVQVGGRELDPAQVDLAVNLADKIRERTSIAGGHTVVALAGATGSGKSSLFNALVGSQVAKIGARRPTTAAPTAAVWGSESATELLDWLDVPARHHVVADASGPTPAVGRLDGLVLLDLPDFDSRVDAHRIEAQRVLELVDVFVWVTDPQKYADALLHEDYVRALATHDAVTVVVLNQADRLSAEAVAACREDLRKLLVADGLSTAQVLVTSAWTGAGIPELVQRIANAVSGANATRHRLSADVVALAGRLRGGVADSEADVATEADVTLVDALSRAAGVPVVLEAVADDYRRQSTQVGGWLFTRWITSVKADPLARLRLNRTIVSMRDVGEADVRAVLGRSSIPPPSPSARAAVSLATRQLADHASVGLPPRWAHAVADAAQPDGAGLADGLDQAVVATPLRSKPPRWWTLMGLLQWVFGLVAIAGALWLIALGVVGWLQLPELPTPTQGVVPWPTLLLGGGLVLGLLAALIGRLFARLGARRRVSLVRKRIRAAIVGVAHERIVDPVAAVLDRHRRTRELLDRARRG